MRRFQALSLLGVVTIVMVCSGIQAATITVPNNSFESSTSRWGPPPNWLGSGAYGTANWTDSGFGGTMPVGADGNQWCFLNNNSSNPQTATISSAADLTTIASDTQYALTVALGLPAQFSSHPSTYTVQLLANGTPVASTVVDQSAITPNQFADTTLNWTSTAGTVGEGLRILVSVYTIANGQGAVDNIRLTGSAAIPEPASLGMGLLGLGLLLVSRRRR